ncbi:MAG: hypothetical protein H8D34_28835 [Chloroflexi bacterium]|nr:hypothetical protein [Chloroflexota bacterium]
MQEIIRDYTGKNHKVEIYTERIPDCEVEHPGFDQVVVAEVDGVRLFMGCIFYYRDFQESRLFSMLRSVEYFLAGKHHSTHYTGNFSHLAVK